MTCDRPSTKPGDPPPCALRPLLFGGAESGDGFLFLATLRDMLRAPAWTGVSRRAQSVEKETADLFPFSFVASCFVVL